MRWQSVDCYDTRLREDTRLPIPKRNSSSTKRQLVDYYSTRPMKRQDPYSPSRNYHSRRQKLIDYYGTRTSSPLPKKELFVQEMTSKSTAMALEKTTQDSQWQASWKGNQPIGRQRKKESTIHLNVKKYCSGNTSTKEPKEFQQIF